jgi:hypothetical protein
MLTNKAGNAQQINVPVDVKSDKNAGKRDGGFTSGSVFDGLGVTGVTLF